MSRKSKRALSQKPLRRIPINQLESLEVRRLLASPIVITSGGTYSGTWESDDPNTPAVTVNTTQPVIIQNSTISSRGPLIASATAHTNITVRNVNGYGLNPNKYGVVPGRFIDVEKFDNLDVENSYLQNTAGIYLNTYSGDHSASDTIKIINNRALNIDGRKSDGAGGWLNFNSRTRKSDGSTEDGYEDVQFVQFDHVIGVGGVDIGWNNVVNQPGNSRVEDNISIYESSGTSASPILIHDNYIQGAYTIAPWQGDTSDSTYTYDWSYSGGGIMLGDVGGSTTTPPAYVRAYNNSVVSTTNYGMAIAAGHDEQFYNNRIVSAGVLSDGRTIQNQNTGAYVWDSNGEGSSQFYNDSGYSNTIGWMQGSNRNDWWAPDPSTMPNNTHWSGTITTATEQAEAAAWQSRHDAQFPTGGGGGSNTTITGGLNQMATLPKGDVTITAGTLRLTAHAAGQPPAAPIITSLAISPGGVLDVTNNVLIIDYPAGTSSPLSQINQWIATARNGGAWNGWGITSTSIAGSKLYSVSAAEASSVLGLSAGQTGTFAGQTVDSTAVLIKFTYAGDANLDGGINIDDYGRIDAGIGGGAGDGWFAGDFNFDHKIDIDDYGIIDQNIGIQEGVL